MGPGSVNTTKFTGLVPCVKKPDPFPADVNISVTDSGI